MADYNPNASLQTPGATGGITTVAQQNQFGGTQNTNNNPTNPDTGNAYTPSEMGGVSAIDNSPVQSPTLPAAIGSGNLAAQTPITPTQPTATPTYNTGAITFPSSTASPYDSLSAPQQQESDLSKQIQALTLQDSSKGQFQADQYKALGFGMTYDANGNIIPDAGTADLTAKLTSLQNQAQQIPLIDQNAGVGRMSTAGIQSQDTVALRNNAIEALTVSSLIAAKNGQLTTAQHYVDNATIQKYGPIEAQLKALQTNLTSVQNSPEASNAEKKQAADQAAIVAQQAAQTELAKTNYTNTQNEVLKYASIADASTLNAMSKAQSPAEVAQIAAQAGITLPQAGRYKDTVTTTTDAFGNQNQTVRVFDTLTGQFVDNSGQTASQLNSSSQGTNSSGLGGAPSTSSPTGSSTVTGSGASGLPFAQYGKLANTDFNPTSTVDQLAQRYLDYYIKKGQVPSSRDLGNGIKAGALGTIDSRARALYYQATGTPLPTPDIIKGYQDQLIGNNKLLNNLNVQEGTIAANSKLLIQNLKDNGVNSSIPLLNNVFNPILDAMGDPNVTAYLAQNSTISNELGSLLALKNAQGSTVYDKLTASGLVPKGATSGQVSAVVNKLLQEAVNARSAINTANTELYKQTDPLFQDANNPARAQLLNQQFVEKSLSSQGYNYTSLMAEMTPQAPAGMQPALDAKTGKPGYATPAEIQAGTAIPL